jgi:hypothetical protein
MSNMVYTTYFISEIFFSSFVTISSFLFLAPPFISTLEWIVAVALRVNGNADKKSLKSLNIFLDIYSFFALQYV